MAAPRRLMVVGLLVLVLATAVVVRGEEEEAAPVTKGFSADVAKMMNIIVHSLYQNPDIFVREMISNAADALTKQRQLDLENGREPPVPYEIRIIPDKEKRTFTIKDTGIGMAREELINNLGSMGSSGTKRFLENVAQGQSSQSLIGQFGVGFYSVFLVAENVKVASKSDNSTGQYVFDSSTEMEYEIYTDPRDEQFERGTEIIIELRPDVEQYAESDKIKKIIDKYSEFIDFPIYVEVCNTTTHKRPKAKPAEEEAEKTDEEKAEGEEGEKEGEEGEEKPKKNLFESDEEEYEETTCEWEHVNEVKPIWLRDASENTEDDYIRFYRAIEKDLSEEQKKDPLTWAHFGTTAGSDVASKSILYIPSKAPPNLFDAAQPLMTNVRLYVRRVFITDEFRDLLPRYLNFIKGVVDSDDLPLNVSREVLQENRLLKVIRRRLTRKVLEMFQDLIDKDQAEKERRDALSQEELDAEDQRRKEEFEKKREEKETAEGGDDGDKKKKKKKKDEDEEEDETYKPKYERFWNEFGKSIRMGVIEDSANRARLTKLLRYPSSASNGSLVGLAEYKERMVEGQKGIFYLSGDTIEKIKESPLLERALSEGVEVLFMTDPIDEYVVQHITEFENNKLMDLAKAVKLRDESSRERKLDKARKEHWGLFLRWAKDTLGGKVEKVELSKRLTVTPCVVVAPEYGVTGRQASIMRAQTMAEGGPGLHMRRILELNPRHSIIDELKRRWTENPMDSVASDIVELLFEVASVQSGFEIDHMKQFSQRMYRMQKHDLNIGSMPDIIEEEAYAIDEDLLADDEEEEDEEPYDPEEEAREAEEEARAKEATEKAKAEPAEAKTEEQTETKVEPEAKASGHDEL